MLGFFRNKTFLALALVATLGLWGCLPEDKDPGAVSDAGKLDGKYYASTLGNMALKIQNLVVSDSAWFESLTTGQELDLAALGVNANGLATSLKSHVCPTSSGTEVVQVTWIDSRDAQGNFALKGVGSDTGGIVASLRQRVSSDQVGIFAGGASLLMSNGQAASLPASCASLAIPAGAPVLAFNIDRPAAPTAELARTEYRTVSCGQDLSGQDRLGTMVESRIVRYLADGTITPSDPEAGWASENLGQCIDSVSVEIANRTTITDGGTADLGNLANISLRQALVDQLSMDCMSVDVSSDMKAKDKNGLTLETRERKTKKIDTCANVSPQGTEVVRDVDTGVVSDTKTLTCGSKQASSKRFLTVMGTLSNRWNINHVTVVRQRDGKALTGGDNKSNFGERETWVGNQIACHGADVFDVQCGNISGAPAARPQQSWSKWLTSGLNGFFVSESWFDNVFNTCWFGCERVIGGSVTTLNKPYFTGTWNYDNRGTRVERSVNASSWADPKIFKPNTIRGLWGITVNQCVWATRTVYQNCPFSYDGRQGNWNPGTLSVTNPHPSALEPGVGAGGIFAPRMYYSALNSGKMPAQVHVAWEKCNIKGCDRYNEYAGPGTGAYIKAWRYGQASSVNGAGVTVQSTVLNRNGVLVAHKPVINSANTVLRYAQDGFAEPLHCGRGEQRALSWPVTRLSVSCGGKGGCRYNWYTGSKTIYENHVREWSGYSYATGTWSRPRTTYITGCGNYGSINSIPRPLPYGC